MSHQSISSNSRLGWIDQSKGIAILTILIFHFFQEYPSSFSYIDIFVDKIATKLGFVAVDIFFIIAGFNTAYSLFKRASFNPSNSNWLSWLKKKFYRLYPTYFLSIVCTLILYGLTNQIRIKSALTFILSMAGIAGLKFQAINPGLWFFTVILEAYLITPLIFLIAKKNANRILMLGIFVGILGKLICLFFGFGSLIFWFFLSNNFIGGYFFQFCLGIFWGIQFTRNNFPQKADFTLSTLLFISGFFIYITTQIGNIDILYMSGFDLLLSPASFLILYVVLVHFLSRNSFSFPLLSCLNSLGIYSYQIYLIHQPLYHVVFLLLHKNLTLNPIVEILSYLLIMSSCLILYVYGFVKLDAILNKALQSRYQQKIAKV